MTNSDKTSLEETAKALHAEVGKLDQECRKLQNEVGMFGNGRQYPQCHAWLPSKTIRNAIVCDSISGHTDKSLNDVLHKVFDKRNIALDCISPEVWELFDNISLDLSGSEYPELAIEWVEYNPNPKYLEGLEIYIQATTKFKKELLVYQDDMRAALARKMKHDAEREQLEYLRLKAKFEPKK